MNRLSRGRKGFTLTEIMVAIMVFAVGILAASGLQISTLRASRQAEQIKIMTELASAQLELMRQRVRDNVHAASSGQSCDGIPSGFSCVAAVQPCEYGATNVIQCSSGTITNPDAHFITVTVSSTANSQAAPAPFTMNTLVRVKRLVTTEGTD